jgi:hypothetical protein
LKASEIAALKRFILRGHSMRRSISTLLTALLLSGAILPAAVSAQGTKTSPTSLNPYVVNPSSTHQTSPFDLAYLAYRGYLNPEGIPSSGVLIAALVSETVTAQDIMQAAVKANRLSAQTLNDKGYRFALENFLQEFTAD